MFKDTRGCVELQWFHDAWGKKQNAHKSSLGEKYTQTSMHIYHGLSTKPTSWSIHIFHIFSSPFKALYTNVPHPVDKPQYHHFCLYLYLKTTKTQREWVSLPPHGNKLQTCPEVWTSTLNLLSFVFEKSPHTMKVHSPSLSYILKLLSSYIPQCIGTFLHKFLQKKLSHLMCFCSYQIYNSSCLPARFFSFSLVSAVIFDAESFAPAYCAWACLLLAS